MCVCTLRFPFLFPVSSPETDIIWSSNNPEDEHFKNWILGGHLRRGPRLETGLFSVWELTEGPPDYWLFHCTVSSSNVACRRLSNFWKIWLMCSFVSIFWVPIGTLRWGRNRDIVVNKATFLFSWNLYILWGKTDNEVNK